MTTRRKMKIGVQILAILILIGIVAAGISAVVCFYHIKVTQYDVVMEGIGKPIRLVVVSDIHGKVYGEDNAPLYEKVVAQEPDAIVLLGDLFPAKFEESDIDYVLNLTQEMQSIAQVYFAMGNHELDYTAKFGDHWIQDITHTGAVVFDESWADLKLNGNTIRFGSSMGHGFYYGRTESEFKASPEFAVLTALETSPYPSILLAHMPDTAAFEESKLFWHIDLVLSGHTHGGVIRLPFVGGVYAPMQGWWPPYDYGDIMLNEEMRMIITSGLSGHNMVPRIFNLPEICVVNLQ